MVYLIHALSQPGAHVNYRDSKLTRLLQPSLSGKAPPFPVHILTHTYSNFPLSPPSPMCPLYPLYKFSISLYHTSLLYHTFLSPLSGNAKMSIICCITPAAHYLEETRSTLQFASR
jgi:hypothetical protein